MKVEWEGCLSCPLSSRLQTTPMDHLFVILIAFLGLLFGFLLAFLLLSRSKNRLQLDNARLRSELDQAGRRLREVRLSCDERLQAERDNASRQIRDMKDHFAALRTENERQWNARFETLKQEMAKQSAELLLDRQNELQESNRFQFDALMQPIRTQFDAFRKSVEESRTQSEVRRQSIEKTFFDTLRLFQQQQETAVKSLKDQTERIGNDAANLTKALKGESKTQGDWGEMILERMLEQSGLRKGEEFFVQHSVKDDDGRNFRPDVVVKFPEGVSVVIDSKVSLTAYAEAVATSDDQRREQLLDEHVHSMRKHVDELSAKNYSDLVKGAVGYVLMFVPNESGYIAAMKRQPSLAFEAYKKHVILLSPTNLMMTLHLTYNLWQVDRQNRNVEEIVRRAADLYDKVVGFQEDFNAVETALQRLSKAYGDAKKKLCEGNGNILRRTESLKQLGVMPRKSLGLDDRADDETD